MHNNSLFKPLIVLAGILLFVSCDKEYSSVGDTLIGGTNFELVEYLSNVVGYNEKIPLLDAVESSNLPVNALGIYENPAFGTTTANFVTQLALVTLNPTIGKNAKIESVYLDIPYFIDTDSTVAISSSTIGVASGNTYFLDSIYGKKLAKIKLSVYESGVDMDSDGSTKSFFYTNQNSLFDKFIVGNRLNDDATDKSQNDEFFFNPIQNSVTTIVAEKPVTTYSAPSMRLKLNASVFENKILKAPIGSLSNQIVFHKHFKGLYFKVEKSGSDKGSLAMINFARGTITIKYKEDSSTTPGTQVEKSLVLNLTGNTLSLLEQSNTNNNYENTTSNPNRLLGDPKLYLKGGEGSLAVLDLFEKKDELGYDTNGNLTGPNNVSDELDKIRKEGWLINDANLIFHIDASTMKDSYEPSRIYLYDFTNNRTISDYAFGSSTENKKNSKYLFGGYLIKDATLKKRGILYKVNVTNHIRSLVKNSNVENVKLGVVVTEDINSPDFKMLKTGNPFLSQVPKASVMNPLGTVLYGGNASEESKRLKLEIYYTKPK